MKSLYKSYILLALVMIFTVFAAPVFASTTSGTVDGTSKYGWSNQIGWINFAPTNASSTYVGAVITDDTITGYAWSQDLGWIT